MIVNNKGGVKIRFSSNGLYLCVFSPIFHIIKIFISQLIKLFND